MSGMRRRFRSVAAFGAAGVCLLMFGVACEDEAKPDENASGGASGATSERGGSGALATGGTSANAGAAGSSSPSDGGAAQGGAGGGEASAGSAQADGGAGGTSFDCTFVSERFASSVRGYEFGAGQSFGQDKFPASVLGPPRGGGCCAGSMDVTSLGDGGFIVLEFAHNVVVDGEGADFLIFENAFVPSNSGPENVFAELGKVSVSQDGESWFAFPCAPTSYPFGACAGWHSVLANADTNSIDATDASVAGGDPFDLADLGLSWARYVRIDDIPEAEGGSGTFDLDAVAIVHPGCQ
jgi:hypothetical protein